MRFFFIKGKAKQQDPGKLVLDKALERVIAQAQARVREQLCYDCLDQRCQTGSVCKAYLCCVDSVAWEITAEKAELN